MILIAGLFALFIGLGIWQLERAGQKRRLHDQLQQRTAASPIVLNESDQRYLDAAYMAFRRVRVSGCFDPETVVFIDNRMRSGRFGYEVLNPFRIGCDRAWILVNRGWIPASMDRRRLPRVETPQTRLELSGIARAPARKGLPFGKPYVEELGGSRYRVQAVDIEVLSGLLDRPLRKYLVALDRDSPAGFLREWPQLGSGAERHIAYAVQWFGIALVWLFVSLVQRRRARR